MSAHAAAPGVASPAGRWRTRDIVVTAVIGAAFGVFMAGLNAVYAGLGAGAGSPWLLLYLGWLLPAVLAPVVVRRAGAGLFAELVAASVSVLVVSQWGPDALLSGFLQGIGAEAVFAAFRYRRFDAPVVALAGAASALLAFVHDAVIYYQGVAPEILALTLFWMILSAAVLMPLVTFAIVRGLREAGALRGLPA
ncbi:MAG: ECF transporter S component [Chloroflexi bacterium]|nr:ECF transporter S component [Chloroflexota bacterium]